MLTSDVPMLTGNIPVDVQALRLWCLDLQKRLEEPLDTGWFTNVATATDKTLLVGDALSDVINVLGTLIQLLLLKGILNP
jgi:hypothetical protein